MMPPASEDLSGVPLRGVIVVLWRAGLRISEALAPADTDLDRARGALTVRRGKRASRSPRWATR